MRTGVKDQAGREIQVGDTIEFSGQKYRIVKLNGEQGHDGYFAQSLQLIKGEFNIVRYLLEGLNTKKVRII